MKSAIRKEIKRNNIVVNRKKFKSNVGVAYALEKNIKSPYIQNCIKIPVVKDLKSVYVIFHEIAHIKFKHLHGSKNHNYLHELEAEQFALDYLKKFEIHKLFPEEYKLLKNEAINYIIQNIYYQIENGLKVNEISVKALQFCKINTLRSTINKIKVYVRKKKK